ncbi:hypothetical protein GUJ93_ZPchr0002g24106 [Zizania palustris]|uniref:Uncharacterized protein n=1 Tax=Zizania palustris TaxID=103762 RepID=A0A8J5S8Z5_ZIZPA|nr:hypothetical protein GUJ93_ZPchr0002g24106 [Zizania palustris]
MSGSLDQNHAACEGSGTTRIEGVNYPFFFGSGDATAVDPRRQRGPMVRPRPKMERGAQGGSRHSGGDVDGVVAVAGVEERVMVLFRIDGGEVF